MSASAATVRAARVCAALGASEATVRKAMRAGAAIRSIMGWDAPCSERGRVRSAIQKNILAGEVGGVDAAEEGAGRAEFLRGSETLGRYLRLRGRLDVAF